MSSAVGIHQHKHASSYQRCVQCVMDTTDSEIQFDENGICSHCNFFSTRIQPNWVVNERSREKLEGIANKIRRYGRSREYDCIIGLSGGVDSSYLLYVAKRELGLRPLAVHVDAGWNTKEAVHNIEQLTKELDIDLFTYVVNWEEMKSLQIAYLRSGLANQDVPQDHAFFAKLYEYAVKNKIKYVLTGSNFSSESILPKSWGYNPMDSKQLLFINKKFGNKKLETFPISGLFKTYVYYPYIKSMSVVRPLNYINYNKFEAIGFLEKNFGWKYYGGKHYESRWTRFFQSYYLPVKFGYDKRLAHYSSLILAGQISREDALAEISNPPFNESFVEADMAFIAKKLQISLDELKLYITQKNMDFSDYPNNHWFEKSLRAGLDVMRRFRIGV